MPPSAKPVFVSYARSASRLEAHALHDALGPDACFLATDDIAQYEHFPARLAEAVLGARVVVVLATSTYFQRWYCLREWLLARAPWDADRDGGNPGDDETCLGHMVVALGDDLAEADLQRLPPPIQHRNLPLASATAALVKLVRERLEGAGPTLADRLAAAGVGQESIEALAGRAALPLVPLTTARIPMWPKTLRPSLGEGFLGRANDFWRLHEALSTRRVGGSEAAPLTAVLHGGGGFGKTQLALEYLHRMGPREYRGGLFWVDASEESSPLQDQFRGILTSLPPETVPSYIKVNERIDFDALRRLGEERLRDILAEALHAVEPGRAILVVVENVPEPRAGRAQRELRDFCPALGRVTCLATSRALLHGVDTITIEVIEPEAAVRWLQRGDVSRAALSDGEWRKVADWVGHLPLALELINASMQGDAVSPRHLLERARSREVSGALDELARNLAGELPAGVVRGITEAFQASLMALPSESRSLAFFYAWLAAPGVPREFLELLRIHIGASDSAIQTLVRRSFIRRSRDAEDALVMHRVLGSFLRRMQTHTDALVRVAGLFNLFAAEWSLGAVNNPDRWPALSLLAPHTAEVIRRYWQLLPGGWMVPLQPISAILDAMRVLGGRSGAVVPLHFGSACARDLIASASAVPVNVEAVAVVQVVLGDMLQTLGGQEDNSVGLQQAIEAYRAALKVLRTIGRLRFARALTEDNLGCALRSLGERERNPARLQEAVAAHRAALRVYNKNREPRDWARVQRNLGAAFLEFGIQEQSPAWLRKAIIAHRAALSVWTKDDAPYEWAMVQSNLGICLRGLGTLTKSAGTVHEAVIAYESILTTVTKDRAPAEWAMAQMNLGTTFTALSNLEGTPVALLNAVAAFRAALEVFSQDHLPLSWAKTQYSLGEALHIYAGSGAGSARSIRLGEAIAAYLTALKVFTKEHMPIDWAIARLGLGCVRVLVGDIERDCEVVQRGIEDLEVAREVLSRSDYSTNRVVSTQHQLAREALQHARRIFDEHRCGQR